MTRERRAMRDERDGHVAVVGGGFAGCAAAVELAQAGHRVTLYEASTTLGGRARTVMRDGLALDNGQHLLLGAYRETRRIAEIVQADADREPWSLTPLAIRPFATRPRDVALETRELPAGLGLFAAVATATGMSWRERLGLIRWFALQRRRGFRCHHELTAAALLDGVSQRARDALLVPLCLAALNTEAERASAQTFLNVLREAFTGPADASSILTARAPLGDVVPERTATWLVRRGHCVRRTARAVVAPCERGVSIRSGAIDERVDEAIVAVGPHQLRSTLDERFARDANVISALRHVDRFEWEAITTIYLGFAEALQLPRGLLRLDDAPGQWLFDRTDILERSTDAAHKLGLRALIAVVISAHRPAGGGNAALARDVEDQLHRLSKRLPAVSWSQVISEKRATYACTPALERPCHGRLTSGLYLAGDYTYQAFPATLEAAVRSGVEAARELLRDRGTSATSSKKAPAALTR